MKRFAWLFIGIVVIVAIIVAAAWPRSITLPINENWLGHYRGFGITDDNSLLGYRYFRFDVDDSPNGRWEIENQGGDFHPIIGYYADGAKRMTGTCSIQGTGRDMYPLIDDIDNATFFLPNGTVSAKIVDGTGMYALSYPDGSQQWTAEYRDHQRLWWKQWNPDGSLRSSSPEQ